MPRLKLEAHRYSPAFSSYWELVKACFLLHGYRVKDGIGLFDPQTGEVWPNPTLHELVRLITGQPAAADPTTKPQLE